MKGEVKYTPEQNFLCTILSGFGSLTSDAKKVLRKSSQINAIGIPTSSAFLGRHAGESHKSRSSKEVKSTPGNNHDFASFTGQVIFNNI